jgi:hypothetical protein
MNLLQRYQRLTFWNKLGAIAAIVGILGFIIAIITFVAWLMPEPPKPPPHFTYSFRTESESSDDAIKLTNDFLKCVIGPDTNVILGNVVVPKPSLQSEKMLIFTINNDSAALAENVDITISLSKEWICEPAPEWMPDFRKNHWIDKSQPAAPVTNFMQTWTYILPFALYPSNGVQLPAFKISQLPASQVGHISVSAKSKNSPMEAVGFRLYFLPKVFSHSFVVSGTMGFSEKQLKASEEAGILFSTPPPVGNFEIK